MYHVIQIGLLRTLPAPEKVTNYFSGHLLRRMDSAGLRRTHATVLACRCDTRTSRSACPSRRYLGQPQEILCKL